MDLRTTSAESKVDRLDLVVVAVTTFTAGCLASVLAISSVALGASHLLDRAINPAILAAVGTWMLYRRKPKVLVQLSVGVVMMVYHVSVIEPNGRPGTLLGMISMGLVAVLFVRRFRVATVTAITVFIAVLAFLWSPPDLALAEKLFVGSSPGLFYVFVAWVVLWMKDELEKGQARYRSLFERYRNLFETAPVGIWDLDFSKAIARLDRLRTSGVVDLRSHFESHPDERSAAVHAVVIRDLNQAAVDLVAGDSKEQVVRHSPSANRQATEQIVSEQLIAIWEGRFEVTAEFEALNLRGETWHGAVTMAALRTEDGNDGTHVIVGMIDVTDRKRAAGNLQQLVASKDEFVAAVSHELRTPLTTVVGLAEELRDRIAEFDQAEVDEFVTMIADESVEVAHIVEDLLVTAHNEIRPLPLALREVDLAYETRSVLSMKRALSSIPASIAGAPDVLADPARVRQILRNLLVNAGRYGGKAVRVVVGYDAGDGVIEVRDNGRPLPDDERELIFDPYHRSHWVDGLAASVGLGLTVSRQLARMMGGDVAYDHDGRESIFRVTLPLAGEANGVSAARAEPHSEVSA